MKNQMTQFVLFALNYNHNFIKDVWGDETTITLHIQSIWNNLDGYNSYARMVKFWTLLSDNNSDKLADYIANRLK